MARELDCGIFLSLYALSINKEELIIKNILQKLTNIPNYCRQMPVKKERNDE